MMILNATDYMTPAERTQFEVLRAEYKKLSTSAKRMKECYAEMQQLTAVARERAK